MTNSASYKVGYVVTCVAVWLLPFFVAGWTGKTWSGFPKALSFQHLAAGLFTRKSVVWLSLNVSSSLWALLAIVRDLTESWLKQIAIAGWRRFGCVWPTSSRRDGVTRVRLMKN
jgi:hypothetical protein